MERCPFGTGTISRNDAGRHPCRSWRGSRHDTNHAKLVRWFWSSVSGELYSSAIESRFARDFLEVPPWILGTGGLPSTIQEPRWFLAGSTEEDECGCDLSARPTRVCQCAVDACRAPSIGGRDRSLTISSSSMRPSTSTMYFQRSGVRSTARSWRSMTRSSTRRRSPNGIRAPATSEPFKWSAADVRSQTAWAVSRGCVIDGALAERHVAPR